MAQNYPNFYLYRSAKEEMYQYNVLFYPNGNVYDNRTPEEFTYAKVNTSSYVITFIDNNSIYASDYADKSILAIDMGKSLGKATAVFVTHQIIPPLDQPKWTDVYLTASVGLFDPNDGTLQKTVVNTFAGAPPVRAEAGFSFVCLVSGLNNVRT